MCIACEEMIAFPEPLFVNNSKFSDRRFTQTYTHTFFMEVGSARRMHTIRKRLISPLRRHGMPHATNICPELYRL